MPLKILYLLAGVIVCLFSSAVSATEEQPLVDKVIERAAIRDADCLACHGVKGYAVPIGTHGDTPKKALHVNADDFRESVHRQLTCLTCHPDIQRLPHRKEGLQKVDCVTCHQQLQQEPEALIKEINQGRAIVGLIPAFTPTPTKTHRLTQDYTHSIHAQPRKHVPTQQNAECKDCHGTHYVFPSTDSRALTYRLSSPEVCGQCHDKALADYRKSVHGAALQTPWKGESAVCSDCHSAHQITEAKSITARRVITENCGNCHKTALASYMDSYHGQLAWLGGKKVAKCYDCHSAHNTRKIDDPTAEVSPQRLLTTCQTCHKNATPSFTQFHPHGHTGDFKKYPELWIVAKLMVALVIVVLLFFYAHSMLWFYRSWKERQHLVHHFRPASPMGELKHFQRFSWPWRLNHWLLALAVMTLVLTGMTAKYADSLWAVKVVTLFGGPENAAIIHRIAAVCFLTAVTGHVIVLFYQLLIRRQGAGGRFEWFGPDSLLPRIRDLKDLIGQFRWFFGKGQQPRFDRWTYWEKFDYWAVYWGALVIGVSGLMLWFSEFLGRYLPGWIFNVATVAHGVEAFLAVTTLFVVHFFNNHFRPGKFPLDTVMFVGSWSVEELQEERPEAYARLVHTGTLEQHLVSPPSKLANFISHLLGFTLIGFGLILLVLVVVGFFQKGLV